MIPLTEPRLAEAPSVIPSRGDPVEPIGLPAADGARLIGVSVSHFYQLHKTGRLPLPVRLGRAVRWLRQELVDWMNAGCPSRSRWMALKGERR